MAGDRGVLDGLVLRIVPIADWGRGASSRCPLLLARIKLGGVEQGDIGDGQYCVVNCRHLVHSRLGPFGAIFLVIPPGGPSKSGLDEGF